MENPKFLTRAYNSFRFPDNPNIIIKRSSESRLSDEIDYYKNLSVGLKSIFAQYIDSYQDGNIETKELVLELYAYPNLFDALRYNLLTTNQLEKVCEKLNKILSIFQTYKKPDVLNRVYRQEIYVHKTVKYYNELIKNFPFFTELSKHRSIAVNNKFYLNFEQIWTDILKKFAPVLINDEDFTVCHGDFIFSNFLTSFHPIQGYCVVKLIDPRGRFGGDANIYGELLYDQSKLMHSVEGYELVINDLFDVKEVSKANFNIEYRKIDEWDKKMSCFKTNFPYNSLVKVVCGMIYIGLISRHFDSLERQKAFYCTGIRLLNESLE